MKAVIVSLIRQYLQIESLFSDGKVAVVFLL